MAGSRVSSILRSKTDLTEEAIAELSDADGWQIIYATRRPKSTKKANQICFTGFSPGEKERLILLATEHGLDAVTKVTVSLAYLCTGPNAGPSKLRKAKEQEAVILTEGQFMQFLQDGEIPLEEAKGESQQS
jgi:NAD-dependent DNA ligase